MVFALLPADVLLAAVMKRKFLRSNPDAQYAVDRCNSPYIECTNGDGGFMFEHTGFFTKDMDAWGYAEAYYAALMAALFIFLIGLWLLMDYRENKSGG